MSLTPTYDPGPLFSGADYSPKRDDARLLSQFSSIRALMLDGKWRTLREIETATGHPPASISAQLRHMRKERFGSYEVSRRYVGAGLYEYRVDPASGHACQLALIRRGA